MIWIGRPMSLAFLGIVLVSPTGLARDLRHPASGEPAFIMTVPDDWTTVAVDGGKSLSVTSSDRRIGFALTVDTTDKSVSEIAKSALTATKGTLLETKPASISGFSGSTYRWTHVNAGGITIRTAMTLIRLEGKWLVSCTKLEVDGNSAAEQRLADTVMQSVQLTKASR